MADLDQDASNGDAAMPQPNQQEFGEGIGDKDQEIVKETQIHGAGSEEKQTTSEASFVAPEPEAVKSPTPVANTPAKAPVSGQNVTSTPGGGDKDGSEAVMKLTKSGKLSPQENQAVKILVKDHAALKIKVDRLKGLLGRSAKAQREAKVDLEVTQKKLEQTQREVKRLKDKVDKLSSRPTHSKLLPRCCRMYARCTVDE